jgi:hypothetical protein
MNVVNPPDLVDQNLYAGLIVCVKRSSFFLIDNQDIAGRDDGGSRLKVFLASLDDVLCPKLRPDHIEVMDNLIAYKVDDVLQRIEACGASLLYLPPYSPDLNPIEKTWSKLKQGMRTARYPNQ